MKRSDRRMPACVGEGWLESGLSENPNRDEDSIRIDRGPPCRANPSRRADRRRGTSPGAIWGAHDDSAEASVAIQGQHQGQSASEEGYLFPRKEDGDEVGQL